MKTTHGKISIVSQSHLCLNPRALKEALALANAGYKITVFTAIYSDGLYQQDVSLIADIGIRYEIYSDLRKKNFASLKSRLSRKFWNFAQTLGIESKFSLGYDATSLKKQILAQPADLYIMHQELATVTGSRMVNKYKVAFDIEDWYSEDLLPEACKNRPVKILKRAEKIAIEKGATCYTTSHAMAKGLQAYYNTANTPSVIYNSIMANSCISIPGQHNFLHLYWLSQTIGEGRGLEFFISCMTQSTSKCKLSLRGNVSNAYKNKLLDLLSPKDRIEFLPLLKNNEIQTDMGRYDIGLALEPDNPLNKELTISNKLFHYMGAGLPIIASYTKGQAEIAEQCPDFVFLFKQNQMSELVAILNKLGTKLQSDELTRLKSEILDFYKSNYTWPIEANKLINLIHHIFETAG